MDNDSDVNCLWCQQPSMETTCSEYCRWSYQISKFTDQQLKEAKEDNNRAQMTLAEELIIINEELAERVANKTVIQ